MKVLFLSVFPPFVAGEGHYASCAVEALRRLASSLDVAVLGFEVPDAEPGNAHGYVDYRLSEGRCKRHFNWALILWQFAVRRPAVVHSQGVHTPRYGGLFGELLLIPLLFLRLMGGRHVTTLHATWTREEFMLSFRGRLPQGINRMLWHYYRQYIRCLVRLSDVTSICSCGGGAAALEMATSQFGQFSSFRTEAHPCVHRPLDAQERHRIRAKLGVKRRVVVLAFGFVRPDKGYDVFAAAAEKIVATGADCEFVLGGKIDKSCPAGYVEALRSNTLLESGCYRFIDRYLNDVEMEEWLTAADILVIPYRRSIGPSGPTHHALGAGLHVLASNIGYNSDLAGVCRLLEAMDAGGLAAAILRLVENNEELAEARRRSLDYAARNTWEGLARHYIHYYTGTKPQL